MTTYKVRIMSLILMLFLLVGCANCDSGEPTIITSDQAALVDKSLITQEPCAPPCWQGIVPGETSHEEVLEILSKLDFIDASSISSTPIGSQGFSIYWRDIFDTSKSRSVNFNRDQIVTKVHLNELWYLATLQEVIAIYGEPDGLMIQPIGLLHRSPQCSEVNIVWFDYGLTLGLSDIPYREIDTYPLLTSNDFIYRVTYSPPVSSILEYSDDSYIRDYFMEWEGFSE